MRQMLHGTAISIGGHGVLIMGESGSGKSDLALRLIDRGAILISDDVVFLETHDNVPILTVAPNIAGKIEVRGVGISSVDFLASAPLRLIVQFIDAPDRLPEDIARASIGDYVVPVSRLNPFEHSSAIKVEYALRAVLDSGVLPECVSVNESLSS
ncbi:HPr kinase/phosphorylase [Sphingorhabdus sp.]|jgi:HPr kinase/phosphorylase|uniref:HPr kinase/phosphorylase n=1 Tax=Sphingorhabdus sp. TaxID=1902408 RepID=UPI003784F8D2